MEVEGGGGGSSALPLLAVPRLFPHSRHWVPAEASPKGYYQFLPHAQRFHLLSHCRRASSPLQQQYQVCHNAVYTIPCSETAARSAAPAPPIVLPHVRPAAASCSQLQDHEGEAVACACMSLPLLLLTSIPITPLLTMLRRKKNKPVYPSLPHHTAPSRSNTNQYILHS